MENAAYQISASELESPLAYASKQQSKALYQKIERAIEQQDVLLAYQPVVAARATDKPAFYEGLFRVVDEDHNILPAGDFMYMAETREMGRVIDCLALQMGLQELAEHPDLRLSINMSARSIGYPRWNKTLDRGLARDKTVAERLILEITESSAMVMPDLVSVFMADLRARGITFALDDFGAGFTAFRYLKEFLFDILKVDGQFISNVHVDVNNQVLAGALVSIGQHFDMLTVAEAVERPEEAAFLVEAGFDCMQGYYFGIPTTTPAWMEDSRKRAAG